MTATEPMAQWASAVARHTADIPDIEERGEALIAEADAAAMDAIRAQQAENRYANYRRSRPSLYAETSYADLDPSQNPRGLVSAWWSRGPRSLTMAGPSRTGKTTAAYAICNDVHHRRGWVIAWTAADLSAALKPDGDEFAYDHAAACELLLIDDLGRERVTDWWLEQLQRLVDVRRTNERRLIVTANTTPTPQAAYDELVGRYGTPVAERLIDDGGIVIFDGPSYRRVVSDW